MRIASFGSGFTSPSSSAGPSTRPAAQNLPGRAPVDSFQSVPRARLALRLDVPVPPGGSTGPSQVDAATPVNPSSFQNGHVYLRRAGTNTYYEVSPGQVPPGALVYVNGIGSSKGSDITGYVDSVAKNNPGQDVYTVYNQTPHSHALDIKSLNDNPGNPASDKPGYYPQVDSLKAILESTGGNVTVMAHSMGMPLAVSAMTQYRQENPDLSQTRLYAWGGVAKGANVDSLIGSGAHIVNFVHESRYVLGGAVNTQAGDNVTRDIGGTLDGGNWAQEGNLTEPGSSDSKYVVGIDYNQEDAWTVTNQGHDYAGQIGDTMGR